MNTQIINAELVLALRKCLPFVKRHAIISGGDGSLTYSFAVRALADADARQREQEAVKNIAEAEYQRQRYFAVSAADAKIAAARAVRPEQHTDAYYTERDRNYPLAKALRAWRDCGYPLNLAKRCDCETCRKYRMVGR